MLKQGTLIHNGNFKFDNLPDRPEKPTSQEIADIITPKPQGVVADTAWTIYSPNERQVGMWQQMVDGVLKQKPVYKKTINFGALPNKTVKAVAHNISNFGNLFSVEAVAYNNDGFWRTLNMTQDDLNDLIITTQITSTDVMVLSRNYDVSSYSKCYITIKYSKTTDTWQTVE